MPSQSYLLWEYNSNLWFWSDLVLFLFDFCRTGSVYSQMTLKLLEYSHFSRHKVIKKTSKLIFFKIYAISQGLVLGHPVFPINFISLGDLFSPIIPNTYTKHFTAFLSSHFQIYTSNVYLISPLGSQNIIMLLSSCCPPNFSK